MRTRPTMTVITLVMLALPLSAADWTIGYEGNDDWAHGFLTITQPVSTLGDGQLLAWGTASYIRYDVVDGASERRVTAPGVGGGVLWRWSRRGTSFQIGPGYEVRWVDRGFGNETESGLLLRADGHHWLGNDLVLLGGATWTDVIDWTSARGSLEVRLGEGLRIGPEAGYQGNNEINVSEIGGIARYPISDNASAYARAGTARTEFNDGRTRSDPYFHFGVGYTIRR